MLRSALHDWKEGISNYRVWMYLALLDIRLKYRRTAIGPFWITLSTGLTVLAISLVFSKLFGRELAHFLPFGAAGIISWYFIAGGLTEGCVAIVTNGTIYQNMPAPYSYAILRLMTRNLIIFAHNFLIFIAVALYAKINFLPGLPHFFISILLVTLNLTWIAAILSIVTARYRDIEQIISPLITILFLVTPIFWEKELLSATWIFKLNPFTYFIDALRDPLLGRDGWAIACCALVAFAVIGWSLALLLLKKTRARIVFWL